MSATTVQPATANDWERALSRAAGLQAFTINGDPGEWFITSGTANASGYVVKVTRFGMRPWATCQCQGAERYEACKHRALVFSRLGILPTATAVDRANENRLDR